MKLLALLLIACSTVLAAPNGKAIYQKHCAKCHGAKGEGAKGEYERPLAGDLSLALLTAQIEKTMPEGAPNRVNGKDTEAVAKYVFDNFYSLDARLRNHPPRIELARLTNRQYVNSVADILRSFNPADETGGPERGLKARYYDSRGFRDDKKLFERIEAPINVDFGSGGPEGTTTNEFAINWRGTIIPDESGVHEFIVRTPLGARLYVNDDEDPAIDAWVSSGQMEEHRVSMRLIGQRAYPIRLECFRFKDKLNSISLSWKPPHGPEQLIPARNLSTKQVPHTFVVQTKFPADDSSIGYERGVSISHEWNDATTQAALETAAYVVKNLDRLTNTKPADTNRLEKVEAFCAEFVAKAFRQQQLTAEQKQTFVTAHFKAAPRSEEAVKRVVLLALKSPRFLYPDLSEFSVATRLAYTLWDSIPDAGLLKADLSTPDKIRQQAERMLKNPRAKEKLRSFAAAWVDMDHVEDFTKDKTLYPNFNNDLVADLRSSLEIFIDEVIWRENDYRKFLAADYLWANQRIADFYSLEKKTTNEWEKITVGSERRGVITHPYLLAGFAYAKATSPIHRGVFLTRNIVGRTLRPPPVAVAFNDAEFDPNMTMRQKITKLTSDSACMGCHSVINPLGFSLEHFDAVGKFRLEEDGKKVDATGEYMDSDGATIQLNNATDLANYALQSPQAHAAFIERLFHHLVKQPIHAYGRSTKDDLLHHFQKSNYNIQSLALVIATRTTRPQPRKTEP